MNDEIRDYIRITQGVEYRELNIENWIHEVMDGNDGWQCVRACVYVCVYTCVYVYKCVCTRVCV